MRAGLQQRRKAQLGVEVWAGNRGKLLGWPGKAGMPPAPHRLSAPPLLGKGCGAPSPRDHGAGGDPGATEEGDFWGGRGDGGWGWRWGRESAGARGGRARPGPGGATWPRRRRAPAGRWRAPATAAARSARGARRRPGPGPGSGAGPGPVPGPWPGRGPGPTGPLGALRAAPAARGGAHRRRAPRRRSRCEQARPPPRSLPPPPPRVARGRSRQRRERVPVPLLAAFLCASAAALRPGEALPAVRRRGALCPHRSEGGERAPGGFVPGKGCVPLRGCRRLITAAGGPPAKHVLRRQPREELGAARQPRSGRSRLQPDPGLHKLLEARVPKS